MCYYIDSQTKYFTERPENMWTTAILIVSVLALSFLVRKASQKWDAEQRRLRDMKLEETALPRLRQIQQDFVAIGDASLMRNRMANLHAWKELPSYLDADTHVDNAISIILAVRQVRADDLQAALTRDAIGRANASQHTSR